MECMSTAKNGAGLIVYAEDKVKGHKVLSQIVRKDLINYVPQYRLRRIKKKEEAKVTESNVNYPKIQIEEVFQLGKKLETINNALKSPVRKECYSLKEVKEIINSYIFENELETEVKRGNIKLDPILYKLVGDIKPDQN